MKKFFIGIDVSKEKVDVCIICNRPNDYAIDRIAHEVFENRKLGFLRMIQWFKRTTGVVASADNALFCCETTGGYDIKLCEYLYSKELSIWRENAIQIKRSLGFRRGKDDVADAWAIAEYAYRHADKANLYIPLSPEIKELKLLVNHRESLVRKLKTARQSIAEISETAAAKSATLRYLASDARREINSLLERIKQCENAINDIVNNNEDIERNYAHITSIKGIGFVNAIALIAYTNNFLNFNSANALATYMGLAPFREMSGSSVNKKVKVGCYSNLLLKAYITQAAECAVRHNKRMKEYFIRLTSSGKHIGVALNNVKNKLVHILFALVKNDCDYMEDHESIMLLKKKFGTV